MRELRKAAGFSSSGAFAEYITRDERTVRRWESGESRVPREIILLLEMLKEQENVKNTQKAKDHHNGKGGRKGH